MPETSPGMDLHQWVERHRPRLARGFVFVTGDAVDTERSLERSRARWVLKPFTMAEYLQALQEVLRERRHAA